MKILIIHNDESQSTSIQKYFKDKTVEASIENNYENITDKFEHRNLFRYDAFIFGITDENHKGLDVLDYMKLIELNRPVIFIGQGSSINLLSIVFARGAEDYLSFPFNMKELELRVMKAIRKTIPKDEIDITTEHTYVFSEQSIALHHSYLDLTKKQKALLYLFVLNKNSLVSYEMIQESIYDGKEFKNNAIATHIRDIRKKIKGIQLKAVKGEGYILKLNP